MRLYRTLQHFRLQTHQMRGVRCTYFKRYFHILCTGVNVVYQYRSCMYCMSICRSIFMKTTKKLTTPTLIFSTMVLNCSHSNPMIDDVPPDRIIAHSTQYEFFCGSLHDYLTTTMDIGHKYARFVLLD